jgi:hypothetical protein
MNIVIQWWILHNNECKISELYHRISLNSILTKIYQPFSENFRKWKLQNKIEIKIILQIYHICFIQLGFNEADTFRPRQYGFIITQEEVVIHKEEAWFWCQLKRGMI